MARLEKEYQKLAGKGRPPFPASLAGGASRLYLAGDHLLKIESSYWSERYRRYYFKDIRVVQVTETRSALVGMILLGLITLFFGLIAWFTADAARIVFIIASAVFGVVAVTKIALGPSCKVQITTPLGSDDLFSLSRLRIANKVLDRIVPLIRGVQENIDPATLVGRMAKERPGPLAAAAIPILAAAPAEVPGTSGKKWVAYVFAALLFLHMALSLIQAVKPEAGTFALALGILVVTFGFSVFLMIRPVPEASRGLVLSFFIYLGVYLMLLYVIMFQLIVTDPQKMARRNAVYPAMLEKAAEENRFNLFINLFAATASGIIGLVVAVRVAAQRQETTISGPLAGSPPPEI